MSKSRLFMDIDSNVTSFKRRCRLIMCRLIRKLCPTLLRNFDKKYPQLASVKKDMSRLAYLFVVKTTLIVVVVPIVVVITLIESVKYLFKRKGEKS